jgi:hypothetical protein
MIGYAAQKVFTPRELRLHEQAAALVSLVPDEIGGQLVRCHELARAIGRTLNLEHEDGRYGFVEHTWLWTEPRDRKFCVAWSLPNVLDVYVPGTTPQVQLQNMATSLPSRYFLTNVFDVVIRQEIVEEIVDIFKPLGRRASE